MLCFNDVLSDTDITALSKGLDFARKVCANERMTTNFTPKRRIELRFLGKNKMTETFTIYNFEDLSTGEIFRIHVGDYDTLSL